VIGIQHNGNSKAYDWNTLVTEKLIQDSMPGLPLMIALESDTATFHVLNRSINGNVLHFEQQPDGKLVDLQKQPRFGRKMDFAFRVYIMDSVLQKCRLHRNSGIHGNHFTQIQWCIKNKPF
jgi:hypothetical protein